MTGRALVVAAATAVLLSGCAQVQGETVPYSWTPPDPAAGTNPFVDVVALDTELVDAAPGYPVGSKAQVRLSWRNTSDAEQEGSSRVAVRTAKGLKPLDVPGCYHALVNDLVCDFSGVLAPGASVSRTLTFKVVDPLEPSGAEVVFTTSSMESTVTVPAGT